MDLKSSCEPFLFGKTLLLERKMYTKKSGKHISLCPLAALSWKNMLLAFCKSVKK